MALDIGDKIYLDIRKQGINGEGIGYFNKALVFVPGAITKERVYCEIVTVEKNFSMGQTIKYEKISKKRVEAPCKYYDDCGGCQMQHIEYKEQLKIKRKAIIQALRKYTQLDVDALDFKKTLSMDDPYHYRNKSQMPFKNTNFGLALGFFKPNSNDYVYIEDCMIHLNEINTINKNVLRLLRKHKCKAYDSSNKDGNLFYLVTRYLESTDSASVLFIIKDMNDNLKKAVKDISKLPSVKSVSYSISNSKSNLVISDKVHLLEGNMWIEDTFEDIKVKISPDAFHQLNSVQMKKMYHLILDIIDVKEKDIVFDLYSGIGITSLLLAKRAKKVYGIDLSYASVKDAVENARINNFKNIEFIVDKVEAAMPRLIKSGINPSIVLMDPPRRGLSLPVIEALLKSQPKRVLYVSCNPSTLAKDLDKLSSIYDIKLINPIDMFPNTASVESITLLELK